MAAPSSEFPVSQAKARLSELLDRVEKGEEITITRMGKPVARLAPPARKEGFPVGLYEGQIEISEDFDDWSEEEARALGMIE